MVRSIITSIEDIQTNQAKLREALEYFASLDRVNFKHDTYSHYKSALCACMCFTCENEFSSVKFANPTDFSRSLEGFMNQGVGNYTSNIMANLCRMWFAEFKKQNQDMDERVAVGLSLVQALIAFYATIEATALLATTQAREKGEYAIARARTSSPNTFRPTNMTESGASYSV